MFYKTINYFVYIYSPQSHSAHTPKNSMNFKLQLQDQKHNFLTKTVHKEEIDITAVMSDLTFNTRTFKK